MKQDIYKGMKHVSVNVDQMQFFGINSVGIQINVDVNVKNYLIKEYVIKDLFGILVIESANVIKRMMLKNIQTLKICKCRKKLVTPLIEECTETVEEVKLAKTALAENENSYKCSSCTVYIVLMIVVFTICAGITTYVLY